ncbi:MAG: hypothetical protein KME29_14825 [Calothrix sp. FI2-JRJ7]|jgi:hypothetical protein|nr:hypothetical protein [Calothrix sp. FI2-JRJ7]
MTNNSQEPEKFDAVKGGQLPAPFDGAVLGGIEGLYQRFAAGDEQVRLNAVVNSPTYGNQGLDILVTFLR